MLSLGKLRERRDRLELEFLAERVSYQLLRITTISGYGNDLNVHVSHDTLTIDIMLEHDNVTIDRGEIFSHRVEKRLDLVLK